MKPRIVPTGNSRGIRIPKPLLEQVGLSGEVEVTAEDRAPVARHANTARAGWAKAFTEMARSDDAHDEAEPE